MELKRFRFTLELAIPGHGLADGFPLDFYWMGVTDDGETFTIIWSIFSYQYNNQQFAFVSVDGFEITNRTVLGCPMFKLRFAIDNDVSFP
ncbi:hypothetical protein RclHR1_24000001 [Rhizophagus clarus]|uniref:Uncharacterized protein n=1 Tax=Rhizophagus clarus TaxID=94130 RepID=A0A2Z6R1P1_9GLOM|nr:hypothetical protein RclHR1_24000001 [Rhizophagus clarus]